MAARWRGWFGEAAPVAPLSPNMVVTEPLPHLVTRSIGVVGGDVYVRQTRRGNVVLGGGRGTADSVDGLARPVSATSLGAMDKTLTLIPDLAHAQVIRSWSGLDGEMPDHIPIIGPSASTPGLVHAFGFSGHGFQLGPVVGEILAELVTQGRSASPLHPFRIERFAAWRGPYRSEGEIEH